MSNDAWGTDGGLVAPPGDGPVPALFVALVDDAAVFPPGSAPLRDAVMGHREHRGAWYAAMIGPLVLPVSMVTSGALHPLRDDVKGLAVGLVADTGIERLGPAVEAVTSLGMRVRQIEAAVAKRGEDPQPGLSRLLDLAGGLTDLDTFAETPLTFGLLAALDTLTEARASGVRIAAKFRTGGLAAELFPTPMELAAVICACRDRSLPFKLTAGLHRAIRHNDPETGMTHHGFVNILAACLDAGGGAEVVTVAERLAGTDPVPLIEAVRSHRSTMRPLWTGFGSCSVAEPVHDLRALGLLGEIDGAVGTPV